MNIFLNKGTKDFNGAALIPVYSHKKIKPDFIFNKKNKDYLNKVLENFDAGGKSAKLVYLPEAEKYGNFSIILLGLGDADKFNFKQYSYSIRRAVRLAKLEKIKSLAISINDFNFKHDLARLVESAARESIVADFDFNKYKTAPKEGWPKLEQVYIFTDKKLKELDRALEIGKILGEEINRCRELANTPGGDMTPKIFAEHAAADAKRAGFKIKILEEGEIKKLGMGGVIGVSKGSSERPRFVIAEYLNGPKNQKPIVLVGKGVTFDSGGLNIKPTGHIYEMHMDMSGGAAVIHALSAIARAKLKVNVVALVPTVENMPSGSSYRPGDILKTITGKTIEVLNTDAEGRVILADGLGYAQRYNPELIVDVATLTGGAVVALGTRAIALFTNRDALEKKLRDLGEMSAEPLWPLPVWDEYLEDIKSTFGDVANDGQNKYGAPIQGAIFLKQFVGDYPWVHLDIAPTVTSIEGQYLAKGASGTSVALLFELARNYSK